MRLNRCNMLSVRALNYARTMTYTLVLDEADLLLFGDFKKPPSAC